MTDDFLFFVLIWVFLTSGFGFAEGRVRFWFLGYGREFLVWFCRREMVEGFGVKGRSSISEKQREVD